MKPYTILTLIAIASGLATGCVHTTPPIISHFESNGAAAGGRSEGTLVVYSAWDVYRLETPVHPRHTNYDIYSADQKLMQHVVNNIMPILADPASVAMAPGSYVVKAKAADGKIVSVPVVIDSGKTTVVRMD